MGGKLKEFIRKRKWRVKVRTWMLIVAVLILLPIDATLLRLDHIKMTELRDQVVAIDETISDNTTEEEMNKIYVELEGALTKLKEFVFSNVVFNVVEENGENKIMFGTGQFLLGHQYRWSALKAWHELENSMADDRNPYGNIYGLAGEHCRPLAIANGWSWDSSEYIGCMTSEIAKYPASEELTDTIMAKLPSKELYRKNYASPVWAPTFTGWMILITLILIVVILIRFIIWLVLRLSLFFV